MLSKPSWLAKNRATCQLPIPKRGRQKANRADADARARHEALSNRPSRRVVEGYGVAAGERARCVEICIYSFAFAKSDGRGEAHGVGLG